MTSCDLDFFIRGLYPPSGELPVALVFGGRGYESEVSVSGAGGLVAAVCCHRAVLPIFIARSGEWYIYTGGAEKIASPMPQDMLYPTYPVTISGESGFLVDGRVLSVTGAFVLLHGDYGEDGTVQGALVSAGIRLIGTDTVASAVCIDKSYTKWIAASLGIPVLRCVCADARIGGADVEKICDSIEREIGYPAFVKPARLGSSIGASPAQDRLQLKRSVTAALALSPRVMAEPMLTDKRELECAYLSLGGAAVISDAGEIGIDGFYSFDEKYSQTTRAHPSAAAKLPQGVNDTVKRYTRRLAAALGIDGTARFDYFLSGDTLYFNEVNTVPGMTASSLYPAMLEKSGISLSALARMIAQGAGK